MSAAQLLAQAILSSPEANNQNRLVSELSREVDRLTHRVAGLTSAAASLAALEPEFEKLTATAAQIIVDIQQSLPEGQSLALALVTNQAAKDASGALTDIFFRLDAAKRNVEEYVKAQTDLVAAQIQLQAAVEEGVVIIAGLQQTIKS